MSHAEGIFSILTALCCGQRSAAYAYASLRNLSPFGGTPHWGAGSPPFAQLCQNEKSAPHMAHFN